MVLTEEDWYLVCIVCIVCIVYVVEIARALQEDKEVVPAKLESEAVVVLPCVLKIGDDDRVATGPSHDDEQSVDDEKGEDGGQSGNLLVTLRSRALASWVVYSLVD